MDNWNELQELMAKGEREALSRFYEQTKRDVWFLCLEVLKDDMDAYAAMQKVYVEACQRLPTEDDFEQFRCEIRRMAAKVCGELIRERNVSALDVPPEEKETSADGKISSDEEADGGTKESAGDQPEGSEQSEERAPAEVGGLTGAKDYCQDEERNRAFLQMMDRSLSLVQYQTVMLRFCGDLSEQEIAGYYHCTEEQVHTRLLAAEAKLAAAIRAYETSDQKGAADDRVRLFPEVLLQAAGRSVPPDEVPVKINEDGTVTPAETGFRRREVKRKKNTKLIVLIVVLVILLIVSGVMFFTVFLPKLMAQQTQKPRKEASQAEISLGPGVMDPTPEEESLRAQQTEQPSDDLTDIDPEKDLTLSTLGVHHVPYDGSYFRNGGSGSTDACTVISVIVDAAYIGEIRNQFIEWKDQEQSDSRLNYDCYFYQILQDDNVAISGYIGYLVAEGKHDPSEFSYQFQVEKKDYSLTLSDTVSAVPEKMLSKEHVKSGNLLEIDGDVYFMTGAGTPARTLELTKDKTRYESTYKMTVSWMRADGDPLTKWDPSQAAYQFPSEMQELYDTSGIQVSVEPEDVTVLPFMEVYAVVLSYDYPAKAAAEEIAPLEKVRVMMADFGLLSYRDQARIRLAA